METGHMHSGAWKIQKIMKKITLKAIKFFKRSLLHALVQFIFYQLYLQPENYWAEGFSQSPHFKSKHNLPQAKSS
jgi:hypothetical protein